MKRRTMIAPEPWWWSVSASPRRVTMATAGNDDTDTPIGGDALRAPLPRRSPTPARAA